MIKVFKLINGEEIISKYTDSNVSSYILESPAMFDTIKDKELHLWHRTGDWSTVKPLHSLPWNYHQ